jgi:hypothetical protein
MSVHQNYSSTSILLFKTLCRISSHEPASNLLPRWLTLPLSTPQYPCTVFVNITVAIQLALLLPRVGRQVTEYCTHYYPYSWNGRCGQQARPAKSPDLTPPWLLVYFWGAHMKETSRQQNSQRTTAANHQFADHIRRNDEIIPKATNSLSDKQISINVVQYNKTRAL